MNMRNVSLSFCNRTGASWLSVYTHCCISLLDTDVGSRAAKLSLCNDHGKSSARCPTPDSMVIYL